MERMVAENADSGEDAGDPVAAVDPDGDAPTYRLSGEDASHFDIDGATGQLSSRSIFDYEARASILRYLCRSWTQRTPMGIPTRPLTTPQPYP